MIQHHGSFAMAVPSIWTAPPFQFGQFVQVRESSGQVVGMEHLTHEQGKQTMCSDGWWFYVLEPRTLTDGRVIADVIGYHESVIQALPSLAEMKYECRAAV